MSRVVVGLDVSLTCTGWAMIVEPSSPWRHASLGVIRTRASWSMHNRLREIADNLMAVASKANAARDNHAPIPLGIETAFVGRNAATTGKLAMAQGAALSAFSPEDFEAQQLAPKEWRRILFGNGNMDKEEGARAVARMLGMVYKPPVDQWEAAGIALAAARKR